MGSNRAGGACRGIRGGPGNPFVSPRTTEKVLCSPCGTGNSAWMRPTPFREQLGRRGGLFTFTKKGGAHTKTEGGKTEKLAHATFSNKKKRKSKGEGNLRSTVEN